MGTIVKSVGSGGGRDFSTIAAWVASLPANLVTDGNSYVAELYNDSEFLASSGSILTLSGHTTDSSHTITVRPASGQGFRDNANKRTNRLTYIQANGVALRSSAAYATAVSVSDTNVILDGLQIRASGGSSTGVDGHTAGTLVKNCIIMSKVQSGNPANRLSNGKIYNSVIILESSTAGSSALKIDASGNSTSVVNCTIVRPSNFTAGGTGIAASYGSSIIRNTAIFGFTTPFSGSTSVNADGHNASDQATNLPGSTGNLTSQTYANQFQQTSTASSVEDFRLKSGSNLIDVGATDATDVPTADDITATSRPQGASWDIGAWEADPPGATSITMTGPTSGTVGTASSSFTIGANGSITGTIVVTPSSGGAGGTFTPTTVSISNGTPTATFTYTAASAGSITISETNNGGLTNASNITFVASNPVIAPTAAITNITVDGQDVIVSGTTTNTPTTVVGTLTADPTTPNGAVTQAGVSGTLGTNTFSVTFSQASNGNYSAETINVSNSAGNANATGSQAVQVNGVNGSPQDPGGTPATAVTLTAPSPNSGVTGVNSGNYTVSVNGTISSNVIVSPNDGGAGGTFTPTTVTLTPSSTTATFVYQRSTVGTSTISVTNDGGLTNPSSVTWTAATAATAVTLTAPSPNSGVTNVNSGNFTVGLNGAILSNVVVTPSDAGAGGTFTPTSVTLTPGSTTATFVYQRSTVGTSTISVTNNSSLSNPVSVTWTAATAATAVTLTAPSPNNGITNVNSGNFTVGLNGATLSNVVVTPSDGGAGGTFTPTTVTLTPSSTTATFVYQRSTAGTSTISVTNNGGLTNPSNVTWTAATAATAVTLTAPSPATGVTGVNSANFTVGLNGAIVSNVIVTPSDGGAGGTFTPTTVTLTSSSTTATFVYQRPTAGTSTISVTNNGGLTNPGSVSLVVSQAATAVTLTAPSPATGITGQNSANFTVGLNGAIASNVTVTPNDGGAGGTFTPTSVTLTPSSTVAIFVYQRPTAGTSTISVTNNGGLTNPGGVSFVVTQAATAVTLVPPSPATGITNVNSANFTVGLNGTIASNVTVTPNDGGAGGTFTPTTVTLTPSSTTATFVYQRPTAGTSTISVTNNGGLTNPGGTSFAVTQAATAVTLTGPTSGITGVNSSNFTAGLNGPTASNVIVTPSDGGAGGTFTPTSVTLTPGSPSATFVYQRPTAGTSVISVTNNAGLTNPSTINFVVVQADTAVTLTPPSPATGITGVNSSNFTVGVNGAVVSNVTVTPSDSGAGGTFTPTSVLITSGSPTATFVYQRPTPGTSSISVTNDAGLTNPSSTNFVVSQAATSVTLTAPSPASGLVGQNSGNFTVGLNGAIISNIIVTPSDAGAGGTFTPTTVTLTSSSTTATFVYQRPTAGVSSISVTNNGSLTNPSSVNYTSNAIASAVTLSGPSSGNIGVNSSNFTVGANGVLTSSVIVTPNDSGSNGVFTPTSVTISSGSPTATFVYKGNTLGNVSIAVTNNGSLTNPSSSNYTVNAIVPTGAINSQVLTSQTLSVSGTTINTPTSGSINLIPASPANGATAMGPLPITLGSGTFTVTVNNITAGNYLAPSISLNNSAGTGGVSGGSPFTVVANAPILSISSATLNATTLNVSGTINYQGDSNGTLNIYIDPVGGPNSTTPMPATVNGNSWTYTTSLPYGSWRVRAIAISNSLTTTVLSNTLVVLRAYGSIILAG